MTALSTQVLWLFYLPRKLAVLAECIDPLLSSVMILATNDSGVEVEWGRICSRMSCTTCTSNASSSCCSSTDRVAGAGLKRAENDAVDLTYTLYTPSLLFLFCFAYMILLLKECCYQMNGRDISFLHIQMATYFLNFQT